MPLAGHHPACSQAMGSCSTNHRRDRSSRVNTLLWAPYSPFCSNPGDCRTSLDSCKAGIVTEHLGEPRLDPSFHNQRNLSSSAVLILHKALTQMLLAGFPSARREKEAWRRSGLIPWPPHLD